MLTTWRLPSTILFTFTTVLTAQTPWFEVDTQDREQTRQFHNSIYSASQNVPSGWTGSHEPAVPGDTSPAFKHATLLRIQYYRAMAGVPAWVEFDDELNQKAQQAALMMSIADRLSHTPHEHKHDFPDYYTDHGDEAAGSSNLAIGSNGPESIDGYIWDFGANNIYVGHRNWLLFPRTVVMGTGDADRHPQDLHYETNALWIFDPTWNERNRPNTREEFVSWPPVGYVPRSVVYPRWSFSLPVADFSQSTVTMLQNGSPISLRLENLPPNPYGEPTLVWVPLDLDADVYPPTTWPDEGGDTTYTVNIDNVLINGNLHDFQYNVIVFDPSAPLPGAPASFTMGAKLAPETTTTELSLVHLPYAESSEFRTLTSEGNLWSDGAESPGGLVVPNVHSYAHIQSTLRASGQNAFTLKTVLFDSFHNLTLNGQFLIRHNTRLHFASQRYLASPDQLSAVELSTDDGTNWETIWHDRTDAGQTSSFQNIELDLSAWSGNLAQIRFIYYYSAADSGSNVSGYNHPVDNAPQAGWAIDDIQLTNAPKLNELDRTNIQLSSHVNVSPPSGGASELYIQLRDYSFGGYPLEWSPLHHITFTNQDIPPLPQIRDDQWIWDPHFGWLLGVEPLLAYSPLIGWLHFNHFPYLRNLDGHWCYWGEGNALDGFWIHVFNQGWQFIQPSTTP